MKPKVSAIITTHNRVGVLQRAIQSVLDQTYDNIELIVVSDGCTDGTDDFIKKIEPIDKIKYISYSPAKGGNYARNQGIINASGDFVAFLDDDDEWLPQKIEKQIEKFRENSKIGLVYVGKKIIYADKKISYNSIPKQPKDTKQSILISNFIGTTSSVMIRRDVLLESGMFDENLKAMQDYDLWIRVCQKCDVALVAEPLINYYNNINTDQISDKTEIYEQSKTYIENKYKDLFQKIPEEKYKEREYSRLMSLANICMRNNMGKKARLYIHEAYKNKKGLNHIIHLVSRYILSFFPFESILYLRKVIQGK